MANDTKKIGTALIHAFNEDHSLGGWAALLAPGYAADYPGAPRLDAEKARAYNQVMMSAFPDARFHVRNTLVDGHLVCAEWTVTGTHTGPLLAPDGQTITATGKRMTESGVFVAEVRNERIVREAAYWNLFSLLAQLGILPGA